MVAGGFRFYLFAVCHTYYVVEEHFPSSDSEVPVTRRPQSKSIQFFLFSESARLLDIFTVGTGEAKGFPAGGEEDNLCAGGCQGCGGNQVVAGSAQQVQAVGSDGLSIGKDAADRGGAGFLGAAMDLSSRVEMPPFLLPGDGFS